MAKTMAFVRKESALQSGTPLPAAVDTSNPTTWKVPEGQQRGSPRGSREAAERQPRGSREAAERQPRGGRGAAEVSSSPP